MYDRDSWTIKSPRRRSQEAKKGARDTQAGEAHNRPRPASAATPLPGLPRSLAAGASVVAGLADAVTGTTDSHPNLALLRLAM